MKGPKHIRTRQRYAILIASALTCTAIGHVLYGNRWKIWPRRFAVVEPGWLYRGGQVDANLIKSLIEKYNIEAILALTWMTPTEPDQAAELNLVRQRKIDWEMIPMPGDGVADFNKLDQAADWIEAHRGRPLFVHCAAGTNRTGAAIAAYRLKYCGWSLSEVLEEAVRFGMEGSGGRLAKHLTKYYQRHLIPGTRVGCAMARMRGQ